MKIKEKNGDIWQKLTMFAIKERSTNKSNFQICFLDTEKTY